MQSDYLRAYVYGEPGRLAPFGLDDQAEEINARLVLLSRKAVPDCLIAGSMTTMAGVVDVEGKAGFEEAVGQYRRQIDGLVAGGAALIGGCCGTTPKYIAAMEQRMSLRNKDTEPLPIT